MSDSEKKLIQDYFGRQASFNVYAKDFTTFKTGGPVSAVVYPCEKKDIEFLFNLKKNTGIIVKFVGNGSNILVSDHGFDGVIAFTKNFSHIECEDEIVSAFSGAKLNKVIGFCIEKGLSGLEFLTGIPGTLGGALIMNAGTKTMSISDIVLSVEFMDHDGKWCREKREQIAWKYRYSQLKEKAFFILSATMKVKKGNAQEIKKTISEIMEQRKHSQPLEYPSAGSVFKNPEGFFAGALIEQAGLKGYCEGKAKISEKHANFIVNTGNASSTDIWKLMRYIQQTIKNKYNITLEPEIELIGRFP